MRQQQVRRQRRRTTVEEIDERRAAGDRELRDAAARLVEKIDQLLED